MKNEKTEEIDLLIIKALTDALDELVTACKDKDVDKKSLMKARAMLPKRCINTLEK